MSAGPTSKHAGLLAEISVAFAKVIGRVGRCRYPLHLTSSMSVEPSGLWRIICMSRTEWSEWDLIPPRDLPTGLNGRVHFFWGIAPRNTDGARRRQLRSQVLPNTGDMGPPPP